jgi:hypothetical protein
MGPDLGHRAIRMSRSRQQRHDEALQGSQDSLTKATGVEKDRAKKHTDLARRLSGTKREQEKLGKDLEVLRGADDRRRKAIEERRRVYASVFETLVEEQSILGELYAPLKAQLAAETGVEKKLEFYVRRRVDIESWVMRGEGLLASFCRESQKHS